MAARTVLITGAGNGIGAAAARLFAVSGDDVVVTDIDADAAAAVAAEIVASGGAATAHRLDVADSEQWQQLSLELRSTNRPPAVIVNNAFFQVTGIAHEQSEDIWNKQLSVTLSSAYRAMRTFHDTLTAARGSMVNVSSVHGVLSWAEQPAYDAAKGGLISLTRQLSVDYAPHVRVNVVLPGAIETRQWDHQGAEAHEVAQRQATLRRLGKPEEVASVIQFLAGDGASYITGASLVVDGGMTTTLGA
ncbi:SDR family oxidoreductase [Salinibacterium sp. UTAS2018]|uniref:SDR family NAD(P)-dependent oxidoreductase n=1 Tax=Salinibacterium sp. UTAS2018 TaxID=2508880 RepID=UPI001009650E|nr:SDR family oxidoreductase [Salinibacterium sp. UTAS2018]QAV70916.1 SDR family oxidoreductase [Salinibacterium sp. UTAS2018]